jgi:glycine/D-amino acid oxidase-like deaminating enzyme
MRITVIGGGIIGLATALRLTQKLPSASITVLEKEAASDNTRAVTIAACCTAACTTSRDQ